MNNIYERVKSKLFMTHI